jgi:TonB family protein
LQKETTPEKAKFSETTTRNPDGSVTTEVKDIKKDEIITFESFKGDEPTGVWKYKRRNIPDPLDYSFSLIYSDEQCKDSVAGLKNYFENNDSLKYIAPKLSTSEHSIYDFLSKHIYYPSNAVESGIQGKVYLAFTITSEGLIENIVVRKGTNILLDKEAVRVMRKLKLSSPPVINGQAKGVCVTFPMSFKLE